MSLEAVAMGPLSTCPDDNNPLTFTFVGGTHDGETRTHSGWIRTLSFLESKELYVRQGKTSVMVIKR